MTQIQLREILARIIGLVNHSFAGRVALQVRLAEIMSDASVYRVEVRQEEAASALGAARASIFGAINDARGVVVGARAAVSADLEGLTRVAPDELAAANRAIGPTLAHAFERPEILVNLMREFHRDAARRRLIEEQADVVMAALGGTEAGGEARQSWHSLQLELAAQRSPEELEALGMLEVLGDEATDERVGAGAYLDAAESLLNTDLALMDPSFEGDRDALQVGRAFSESTVNRFELEHAPQHVV